MLVFLFFCQAEDGIRYLVRSRGLGDVYKRQDQGLELPLLGIERPGRRADRVGDGGSGDGDQLGVCLLYTSDAADERSSVDLGGRRIIKKKKQRQMTECSAETEMK